MIQRIQTFYLLLFVLLFAAFAYVNEHSLRYLSESSLWNVSASIMAGLALFVSGLSIFLYNNRSLQIKVIWLSLLLVLSAIGLYIFVDGPQQFFLDWPFYILPAGVILQFLAKKGVQFDQNLIKSSERLR
jgi:uncharacterized membrane protein YhaH (DUF805 family)